MRTLPTIGLRVFLMMIMVLSAGCGVRQLQVKMPDAKEPAVTAPAKSGDMVGTARETASAVGDQPQPEGSDGDAFPADSCPPNAEASGAGLAAEPLEVLSDLNRIEQRLARYAERHVFWGEYGEAVLSLGLGPARPDGWDQCLASVDNVQAAYGTLRQSLLPGEVPEIEAAEGSADRANAFWLDLNFLESDCAGIFAAWEIDLLGWLIDRLPDFTHKAWLEPIPSPNDGQPGVIETIVNVYPLVHAARPADGVSAVTNSVYGLALLHAGRLGEAAEVLSRAIPDNLGLAQNRELQRIVADLQLAVGNYQLSGQRYRELLNQFACFQGTDLWVRDQLALLEIPPDNQEEWEVYRQILRAFLMFDGVHVPDALQYGVVRLDREFPESQFAANARQIQRQAEDLSLAWIDRQLRTVDTLVAVKHFPEALAILDRLLADQTVFAQRGDVVRQIKENVLVLEVEEAERQKLLMEQSILARWEEANSLYDMRRYDESLVIFSSLLETDYREQAEKMIAEARTRAASSLRKDAAGLFAKAGKATDPELKVKYLLESRALLRKVLVDYPGVDIADKVRQNLNVLEENLAVLRPGLLEELRLEELPETMGEPVEEGMVDGRRPAGLEERI